MAIKWLFQEKYFGFGKVYCIHAPVVITVNIEIAIELRKNYHMCLSSVLMVQMFKNFAATNVEHFLSFS